MSALLRWEELTGRDIAALDRSRTALWVTCSPIEVHGPHLPTVTDNLEARAIAHASAALFARRFPEVCQLELPPLYVGADVLPHVGSLAFRPTTVLRVVEDLGRTLALQGFRHIWVTNFHGGPRHFVPLELACDRTNRRHGARMVSLFSLLLTRLTGGTHDLSAVLADAAGLAPADLVGDGHGGAIETSLMLHLLGSRVDPGYRALGRRTVEDRVAARGGPAPRPGARPSLPALVRGLVDKLRYFHEETWAGTPALASPEAGERILARLAELTADALAELWTGRLAPEDCRSPLWPARWLFTEPRFGDALSRALGLVSPVG